MCLCVCVCEGSKTRERKWKMVRIKSEREEEQGLQPSKVFPGHAGDWQAMASLKAREKKID